MDYSSEKALELHRLKRGKVGIYSKVSIRSEEELRLAYVPGSSVPALEISRDRDLINEYTGRGNRLAIITNGTAVLGLGDVGPYAAMPVMEGKCALLKNLADVDAFPICIESRDPDDFVAFARLLGPTFGAINVEDVRSPDSFYVTRKLQEVMSVPVLCDDQHGSAAVVLAALSNAFKVVEKDAKKSKICIVGAGVAGVATAELLLKVGVKNLILVDKKGILDPEDPDLNDFQRDLARRTNPEGLRGGLSEAVRGADALVGLSVGGVIKSEHVKAMGPRPIVLALAIPTPEISAAEAKAAGAYVVATGVGDCPNHISNVLAFPGMVRGLLDVEATSFHADLLVKAAETIAEAVERRKLGPNHIVPDPLEEEVAPRVAEAVAQAAVKLHIAKKEPKPGKVYKSTIGRIYGEHNPRAF